MSCINTLQDALTESGYKGAMVVTIHARKANNPEEVYDNICGSTGQRGSFVTNIMLTYYRKEKTYTISSDQTFRDDLYGELEETILLRDADGRLSLGQSFSEIMQKKVKDKVETSITKLLLYLDQHPKGSLRESIQNDLGMSSLTVQKLLTEVNDLVRKTGAGHKGDPHIYFGTGTTTGCAPASPDNAPGSPAPVSEPSPSRTGLHSALSDLKSALTPATPAVTTDAPVRKVVTQETIDRLRIARERERDRKLDLAREGAIG